MRKPFVGLLLPALGLWWLFFLPHRWMPDPAGAIAALIMGDWPGAEVAALKWQIASWLRLLPQIILFIILSKRSGALGSLRPKRFPGLALRAIVIALLTSILAIFFSLPSLAWRLLAMTGLDRFPGPSLLPPPAAPSPGGGLAEAASAGLSPLTLLPVFLVTALCVGYREELFFRFYLTYALAGSVPAGGSALFLKFRPWLPLLASSLLFAISHWRGQARLLAFSFIMAILYGLRARKRADLHELALGHALYDLPVLAMAYGGFPL